MAAVFFIAASTAYGFGSDGHQAVGAIADVLLQGTKAQQQVRDILGTMHSEQLTLRQAAVWPDCVRTYGFDVDGELTAPSGKQRQSDACQVFAADKAGRDAMKDYVRRNNSNCEYAGQHLDCHKSYHFADVAIQRDRYSEQETGANNHDVVHAINAAILVLQGKPAPAPFSIRDKREALFLLAHFVGDIHQPLHVGAVYLDTAGHLHDPDKNGADETTATRGGNSLRVNKRGNLHGDWDTTSVMSSDKHFNTLARRASHMEPMSGDVMTWSTTWANDSLAIARRAFRPVQFAPEDMAAHQWPVEFEDRKAYLKYRQVVQDEQIARAGARLAQVLQQVWPQ
ncbi:MAG TPA: S1/P1 nuclease [Pseudomonadales bacterium]|nr:S1/P1 nuclease [Pseudomonadales bacterium]